jgi:polar amino acid transport system substrate-binding protein
MRARRTVVLAALSLLLALSAAPLVPSAAAQTVDEIIKRGKVIVGVNTTTPIFGLVGSDGQPEGYDPDVARLVGKYLGVQVEFVPVTGANRLPFLLTNRVDMVIALFGITPERAQQIWFSMPYATEAATLVAPCEPRREDRRRPGGPARRRAARRDAGPDPHAAGRGEEDQPHAFRR